MDILFQIESQEEFEKVVREVLSNFYVTKIPIDANLRTAKDDVKKLLLDNNFDTNIISELLVNKGWDGKKIALFISLLKEKKPELLYESLLSQNSEYGETVTSFEWLLKLVLGTSELNTLKYPLLQIILCTANNGIQKKLMYDVNKDMLLKTIDVLETLQTENNL